MANTDYGAIPLTLATAVSQKLNQKLGVTTGFKPSEWADAINLLGRLPNKTVSGSICHFTDGVSLPLVNGKFDITAYQDGTGTPSPSNVRAIHGYTGMDVIRTGKNLFDKTDVTPKKYIDVDGNILSINNNYVSGYIPVKPNTIYYLNQWVGSTVSRYMAWYDKDKVFISTDRPAYSGGTLTAPSNAYFIRLTIYIDYLDTAQLELGSSATAYSAYNGTTYPLTWQNECYGGYIDYKRGKKLTTYGKVDLGNLSWKFASQNVFYSTSLLAENTSLNAICSCYNFWGEVGSMATAYNKGDLQLCIYTGDDKRIIIRDDSYNGDVDTFTLGVTGQVLVYELANPIEEDITLPVISLLDGENNIWNTCGDSEITYIASSAKTGINFSADVNSGWSATDATRTMMTITASGDAQVIFGKGATGITNCSNNHAYMKLIKNSTEVWTKTLPQNTTTKLDDIPDISLADGDQLKLVFGYASTHSNINMHFNNGYLQIAGNADVKGLAGVSNTYFSLIGIS